MASQAEVDLVISTAGALPNLQRELDQILRVAENGADSVDVQVGVDASRSLARLDAEISSVINRVEGDIDGVEVGVLVEQREAVRRLRQQVDSVVRSVDGSGVDPVSIQGVLDSEQTLRTVRAQLNRVADRIQRTAPEIEIEVGVDRNALRGIVDRLGNLAQQAGEAALTMGRLGASVASTGVALGALLPVLAGVGAAIQQVAPAAAVAASGLLAVALAGGTVKLAMQGVEDAISAAFDPDTKPEELEKQLKRLAPEARKFVVELRSMRGALRQVQQEVQNRLFRDFDDTLQSLSKAVLPDLRRGLDSTADTLNKMGLGAANAAAKLGEDGTLGVAIDGAAKGLKNLEGIPGLIVTALGQLAAASSPALDRLTRRVDTAATKISERLTKAFESGELEGEINKSIDALGQLKRIGENVLGGLGNIFKGVTQDGRGLFDTLEDISQKFEELTGSQAFQTILDELSKTANTLAQNVMPLLRKAFEQLAPVFEKLGPPLRQFIDEVAPEVKKVLNELGPVLKDLAIIIEKQMPFAIAFAKAALQSLTVVLKGLHFVLDTIVIPIVEKAADIIGSKYVKDIAAASQETGNAVINMAGKFDEFRQRVSSAVSGILGRIGSIVNYLKNEFLSQVTGALATVAGRFRDLPGEIRAAFGVASNLLFSAGADILRGLIGGILSQVDRLLGIARSIADRVTSTIKDALDIASPSRVMIGIGEDTVAGLEVGLKRMLPSLESTVSGIAGSIAPSFALPGGQNLSLSAATIGAPTVQVFIGNEQLNGRIDTRISANNKARNRVLSQGIRR